MRRQWRRRSRRATAGRGFSQGFCLSYQGFCLDYQGFCPGYPDAPVCGWQKTLGENRPRPGSSTGDDWRHKAMRIGQLFSSDLIRLSNSSNEVSPLIISPLMKKVGVELTFSTSLANF